MASGVEAVIVRHSDGSRYLCKKKGDVSMTCGCCRRGHVLPKLRNRCRVCRAFVVEVVHEDGRIDKATARGA